MCSTNGHVVVYGVSKYWRRSIISLLISSSTPTNPSNHHVRHTSQCLPAILHNETTRCRLNIEVLPWQLIGVAYWSGTNPAGEISLGVLRGCVSGNKGSTQQSISPYMSTDCPIQYSTVTNVITPLISVHHWLSKVCNRTAEGQSERVKRISITGETAFILVTKYLVL